MNDEVQAKAVSFRLGSMSILPAVFLRSDPGCHSAAMATVFLSAGTPLLLGGDEFGRSQMGNNNAYCQDNSVNWLDWSMAEGGDGRTGIYCGL